MANHNEPAPRILSDNTRALRLYDEDDRAIMELQRKIFKVSGMSGTDLVRDAVSAGRPIVERRWKPIVDIVEKEK